MDEILADTTLRTDDALNFYDKVFQNRMNKCIAECKVAMDGMLYHNALVAGVFELSHARDNYRLAETGALNKGLLSRWMEAFTIMISPFCPHFSQHCWEKLGKDGFVVNARWPEAAAENELLSAKMKYLEDVSHNIRSSLTKKQAANKKKKKGQKGPSPPLNAAALLVARGYNSWQTQCLTMMLAALRDGKATAKTVTRTLAKQCSSLPEAKANKKLTKSIMQFVGYMAGQYAERGESALSLEQPFDEFKLLTEHLEFVKRGTETELGTFEILDAASEEAAALLVNARGQQEPSPGKPQPLYYNLPAAE
jgi:leucyl-tRNA synthetase